MENLEINERTQIKRKWGQYPSHNINSTAPIRDKVIEFFDNRFVNDTELANFLIRLEEDRGNPINHKLWFSRNKKYFESFEIRGQKLWTLSKYGKRVLEFLTKQKTEKIINESVNIGLFKYSK